jgi:anthranilate phosphoribosyltransferase
VANGEVLEESLNPLDLGIAGAPTSALSGGDAIENAAATRAVLAGALGPHRDAILLNAAATLAAFDAPKQRELSLNERMETGLVASIEAIDSGAAEALLSRWVERSQSLRGN